MLTKQPEKNKNMKRMITVALFLCSAMVSVAQNQASFKLPAYEKLVLKNGLTVYLMEQHEVPMINVSVILPAGAIYDKDQNGLAAMTADALMNGTRSFTKSQIEEQLDFVGATVNVYASKESAGLGARFASKDRDKVLGIISEILMAPSFDTTEFEKDKQLRMAGLEQAKESPRAVIDDYFSQLMFSGHVYANPPGGRISTVSKISTADARRFYNSYYIPNGSAIAIVGDFNTKEMKTKLSSLFAAWKKGTAVPGVATQNTARASTAQVLLVNKDDARETTFFIGGPGVPRSNPDYVAMEVVNTAFGGRFTSWLNDELRVNTGLTYGAGSSFNHLKNAGTFRISTFTATKNTEAAMDKALEVLKRLHTTGLDETTLTSAKNYVKGQFPPRYETSGQLASLLTQMYWYGFDESFINNFQKSVDELTVEKAKQIVAKYYPRDNLQIVMVGKADDIRTIAAKYGKVTEVQIRDEAVKTF
jgi:zinc protease